MGHCRELLHLNLIVNEIDTVREGRLRTSWCGQDSGLLLETPRTTYSLLPSVICFIDSQQERVTYCTMYTYSVVLESFGLTLSIWSKQVWKTSWSLFDCILWSSRHRWEPVWLSLNFHFGSVTTSCSQSSLKCITTSKSSFQKKKSS